MRRLLIASGLVVLIGLGIAALTQLQPPPPTGGPLPRTPSEPEEASPETVHRFCGAACHTYPPPESFPRSLWRKEVKQGFEFYHASGLSLDAPSLESVVRYYEQRAAEELPALPANREEGPCPVQMKRHNGGAMGKQTPAVANLLLASLGDSQPLDLIACDMRSGDIAALRTSDPSASWRVLGDVPVPAHVEVVDLDKDRHRDLLIASLGAFYPTDSRVGGVYWLRGSADGRYKAVSLLGGVGRVADVQAADFNGDGKLDLIVAVFGWRKIGEILYLENRTTDWAMPSFVAQTVDPRHGAIHVPVCDLNRDGRPDFIALLSQEHEQVVAYYNEGGGRFRSETLWAAPHPAYGCSGLQLVDFDKDGDLDVLLTNGDALDDALLKPYHGVQWLENRGPGPFRHHPLTTMPGVMRAVAADFDGDGRLDVAAVSLLPPRLVPQREQLGLASVVLLHQTAPGQFSRYTLERGTCDHASCVAGDLYGDGGVHLAVSRHFTAPEPGTTEGIVLWRNALTTGKAKP